MNKSKTATWVSLEEVIELINHPDFYWGSHNDFIDLKYINLRIDTRDLACIVRDRNNKPVDIKKIKDSLPDVVIKGMNETADE